MGLWVREFHDPANITTIYSQKMLQLIIIYAIYSEKVAVREKNMYTNFLLIDNFLDKMRSFLI